MSWTEMENKAQNHVMLQGNVDGNSTFFKELKAKEKKEKGFLYKGKVFVCLHCM